MSLQDKLDAFKADFKAGKPSFNVPPKSIRSWNALQRNSSPVARRAAMPARYVIGENGVVLYPEVNRDYTQRPQPEDILPILEKTINI